MKRAGLRPARQKGCVRMTAQEKLQARKKRLIDRLQEEPDPHTRVEIERQLIELEGALNLIKEAGLDSKQDREPASRDGSGS